MEKHRAHRRKKALATSFVITIGTATSVASATSGCKKSGLGGSDDGRTSLRSMNGECFLDHHMSCPRGATCNPPPPTRVECPPELRDAGEPAPAAHPPGKESWLRVPPELWFIGKECQYRPEYFCPKPPTSGLCTAPKLVNVACTRDPDAGAMTIESFVYTDGAGVCRKVPAGPCARGRRGDCAPPPGDVVPCAPQ